MSSQGAEPRLEVLVQEQHEERGWSLPADALPTARGEAGAGSHGGDSVK